MSNVRCPVPRGNGAVFSFVWMVTLVGMLLVPPVLIVVVNAALMRIVVSAYL